MHLTVFGASGRTGVPFVEQALAEGHTVTAFVRDASRLRVRHERLRVLVGDVQRADRVYEAVRGAQGVVSVIGHAKGAPADVQTVATRNVVAAMRRLGGGRLVSLTGAGVADPKDPPYAGAAFVRTLMGVVARSVLADAQAHADLLRDTLDLEWTIVRAPRLTEGPRTGLYKTGYLKLGLGQSVARGDVAHFMLRLATRGGFEQEAPMITADVERQKMFKH